MILKKFQQIWTEEERKKQINKHKRMIKKLLSDIDQDTLKLNDGLIDEAATYAANLVECNELIKRDGLVDTYQNGENQWGTKKSVAAELKPKYTATYQSLIRQLSGLLPTEKEKDAAAELMEFINRV